MGACGCLWKCKLKLENADIKSFQIKLIEFFCMSIFFRYIVQIFLNKSLKYYKEEILRPIELKTIKSTDVSMCS